MTITELYDDLIARELPLVTFELEKDIETSREFITVKLPTNNTKQISIVNGINILIQNDKLNLFVSTTDLVVKDIENDLAKFRQYNFELLENTFDFRFKGAKCKLLPPPYASIDTLYSAEILIPLPSSMLDRILRRSKYIEVLVIRVPRDDVFSISTRINDKFEMLGLCQDRSEIPNIIRESFQLRDIEIK